MEYMEGCLRLGWDPSQDGGNCIVVVILTQSDTSRRDKNQFEIQIQIQHVVVCFNGRSSPANQGYRMSPRQ